jgi:nitrite reductase (NADH) small subunit
MAIFRMPSGAVVAVGNHDPFCGANVISRGIVGSVGEQIIVSSPMYKQRFDLSTGVCLDDETVSLPVFLVREVAGRIEVAHEK